MILSPEIVTKVINHYLKLESVGYGGKIKKINNSLISVYDGDYPMIEIIYEGKVPSVTPSVSSFIARDIENITGLKHKKDFWLGVGFE